MTVENIDLKTIGFFSLVGQAYVFKFLWSPLPPAPPSSAAGRQVRENPSPRWPAEAGPGWSPTGLPLALTSGTLQAWMTVENIDLKTIGFFSLVGQAYVRNLKT
jgi:hypothetical protein